MKPALSWHVLAALLPWLAPARCPRWPPGASVPRSISLWQQFFLSLCYTLLHHISPRSINFHTSRSTHCIGTCTLDSGTISMVIFSSSYPHLLQLLQLLPTRRFFTIFIPIAVIATTSCSAILLIQIVLFKDLN